MSNDQFAKRVVNAISDKIPPSTTPLKEPLLFIIGEEHVDKDEASAKSPAMQALYSEIAALELARQKVGAEKVSLSVELSPETLQVLKGWVKASHLPNELKDQVFVHAIQYAMQHGIEIYPSQTNEQLQWNPSYALSPEGMDKRNTTMINTINQLAGRHPDGAVVHIVGAGHLYGLAGISSDDLVNQDGHLVKDPQKNPFGNTFSSTIIVNAALYTEDEMIGMSPYEVSQQTFSSNPSNALQLLTPPDFGIPPPADIVRSVTDAARTRETDDADKQSAIVPVVPDHSVLAGADEKQQAIFMARFNDNLKKHFGIESAPESPNINAIAEL